MQRNLPNLRALSRKRLLRTTRGTVDHRLALDQETECKHWLRDEGTELNRLVGRIKERRRSLMGVFPGRDGSGGTGATVRIIEALDYDMRIFQALPIGPPTTEELEHPYLFPDRRADAEIRPVRVFDRNWAERLLAEPVMSLTKRHGITHPAPR